jgi:hypothetical protein
MNTKTLLTHIALGSSIAFIASTAGSTSALTACGIFTTSLMILTLISDYSPRRQFGLSSLARSARKVVGVKSSTRSPLPSSGLVLT